MLGFGALMKAVCSLFGGPGMGRVYSRMRSPRVGRTCFGTRGSGGALGSVATGNEQSDGSTLGFGVPAATGSAVRIRVLILARFGLEFGVLV